MQNRQIIYVATTPGRIDFITNFLNSVKNYNGKYPIFIESGYGYDWFDFAKNHNYDEILFLHDSVEIKDLSFFDLVFETHKRKSVSLTDVPYFIMGLGKFLREPYLATIATFPPVPDAYMSYRDVEFNFGPRYCEIAKETPVVITPEFNRCEWTGHKKERRFTTKFGRYNLILQDKYIRKYKGHWRSDMLQGLDGDGFKEELKR
jgi:hypothetical protein